MHVIIVIGLIYLVGVSGLWPKPESVLPLDMLRDAKRKVDLMEGSVFLGEANKRKESRQEEGKFGGNENSKNMRPQSQEHKRHLFAQRSTILFFLLHITPTSTHTIVSDASSN